MTTLRTRHNHLAGATVFALVVVVAFLSVSVLLNSTVGEFHSQRVAGAVALWVGWPIYPDMNSVSGAITLYPPLFPAFYLPAAVFMDGYWTPVAASALSALYLLLPLWLICRRVSPNSALPMFSLAALCLLHFDEGTKYVIANCISEAPVIFLLGMGSAILLSTNGNKALYAGVLFAATVFTKQPYLLTLAVPGVYFILWRDWKNLRIYLLSATLAGLLLSGILIAAFGYQTLWFNLVDVPSKHPLEEVSAHLRIENPVRYYVEGLAISAFGRCWVATSAAVLAIILAMLSHFSKTGKQLAISEQERAAGTLLLLLCLTCLVTGVVGMAKAGGAYSALAPFAYFAILFYLLAGQIVSRSFNLHHSAATVILVVLSLSGIVITWQAVQFGRNLWFLQPQTTEMVRKYQGRLIFLNNPLAHLLVEERNYPSLDVLLSLELAGYNARRLAKQEISDVNPEGLGLTYYLISGHCWVLDEMYAERPEQLNVGAIRIATFPNPEYVSPTLPLEEDFTGLKTNEEVTTPLSDQDSEVDF